MKRWTASIDTSSRRITLIVDHNPPKHVFTILDKDLTDAAIRQQLTIGAAATLEKAIQLAEIYATKYLKRGKQPPTIPFWVEEEL